MFFPKRSSKLASLLILHCLSLSISRVNALPFAARQTPPDSTVLQTVRMTNTAAGVMTETCVITLTPITDVNGQPAVEEVRTCTITMDEQSNGPPVSPTDLPPAIPTVTDPATNTPVSEIPPQTETALTVTDPATNTPVSEIPPQTETALPPDTTTVVSEPTDIISSTAAPTSVAGDVTSSVVEVPNTTAVTQSTDQPASEIILPPSSSAAVTSVVDTSTPVATLSPPQATETGGTPASSPGPQASVNGLSTVAGTAPTTASDTIAAGTSTPQPDATPTAEPDSTPTTAVPPGASSESSTGSAAAAAEPSSSAAPEFELPGKQLSVLPIGLGVFAGISVIALIVVGLVTYERTKYRKAFRQRKLAESGAAMGYGGNAQGR